MTLRAPFPWFGGKRKVAHLVWPRFGAVQNYVEPFFGSGAMLLARPQPFDGLETINDADAYVANFWRAIKADPDAVAQWADHPVNENDLHARHIWLVQRKETLRAQIEGDPDYCDARIAGYWVWGVGCWIGGGFCSGDGPWQVNDEGQLVQRGTTGQGVRRQRVVVDRGRGVHHRTTPMADWFAALSDRLRRVRVCSGDWSRVCGPAVTVRQGLTAVFLDPPYADTADRSPDLYAHDSFTVAHEVRAWAITHGDDPRLRIALCGYEGEHVMPASWSTLVWDAGTGYSGQAAQRSDNGRRERIWFSPHCLPPDQARLF